MTRGVGRLVAATAAGWRSKEVTVKTNVISSSAPRIAVIGCGAVTEQRHLPALAALNIKPALLVDINLQRAETLAAAFQAEHVSDDYRSRIGDFDAAIVASPHHLHAPVCVDLLGRGIHVLVEKPMARTTGECDAMIAAATEGSAILAVGLMRRFRQDFQWVKKALDAGVLGRIKSFDFQEGRMYGWPVASGFIFRKETAGGGVLIDTGAHTLDLLLWWLGDVASVGYYDDNYGGVEADCKLQLTLAGGGQGVVELSRTQQLRNSAILRGERGEIEVGFSEDQIHLTARPKEILAFKNGAVKGSRLPPPVWEDLFVDQIKDWLQAIKTKQAPLVSGLEGRRSIALIETCYEQRKSLELPWVSPNTGGPVVSPKRGGLTGKNVLITGATGFIGGRLVEKLILDHGAKVRALIRAFAHASRIARFDLEMIPHSILDVGAVDRAVAGCDVVFHCAHDFQDAQLNLDGAQVLAGACLRHKVKRLVHVSSISVYQPLADGDLDETSPAEPCGWIYPDNKLTVEKMLLQYGSEHGLPVTVLQPTIVYGPYCRPWTISPVWWLTTGRVVLPDIEGICNSVYVDDVVDALILAAEREEAVGERFLISGPDVVTWRDFYAAYERMLEVESVVAMPLEEINQINRQRHGVASNLKMLRKDPLRAVRWTPVLKLRDLARRRLGESFVKKAKKTVGAQMNMPAELMLDLYRARTTVRIDKARRLLGYEPAFDFERGMNLTAQFVKRANP